MSRTLFGTDGIRGTANAAPMDAETALAVAMAAAVEFNRGDYRHTVVIGKDTRLSGYLLEPAMTAGFVAMGMDVVLVGPLPTPAIAMLTRSLRADLGVMISASHNPFQDNGIKLFGPDGYKLSDEVEAMIERHIANGVADRRAAPHRLGRAQRLEDARGRYIEFVKASVPRGQRLDGLKIVVDCANGAAYNVAPRVLWELGAEVVPIGVAPDGININKDCGATSTDAMRQAVAAHGAAAGIALDGDADRLIMADETGAQVDGDQLMALIAHEMAGAGRLQGNGLVATVMSNLGLERYLQARGLRLVRTAVGDRYVVEHMRANGFNLGGEQSGHIVLSDFATTGDGLCAALQVLVALKQSDRPMSALCHVFDRVPQVLRNVRYAPGSDPLNQDAVTQAIASGERRLGGAGRLVIRKSGTEPLIRVMVEADDADLMGDVADRIVAAVERVGVGAAAE